jgi:protein tyrosine phosphatase (PTP) superfamily phosphohydrolase (DUF442 family)
MAQDDFACATRLTEAHDSAHFAADLRTLILSTPRLLALLLLVSSVGRAEDPAVKRLEAPGIENFFAVTHSISSGGSPETEEAFQALAKLGIKTIITVDGAKPNVELAHRYGFRYIHLPLGYDGIPKETAVKLVKAAKTAGGPVFVHCHHGKHRGPAAVGVICQATANWSPQTAEAWMKRAGTSTDYDGLYRSVLEFRPPSTEELANLPGDFPETAEVSAMVDTMVEIEQRWDRLKKLAAKSEDRARMVSEAVLLWEQIREAQRLPESAEHGDKFQETMAKSEMAALRLREILAAHAASRATATPADLQPALDAVAQSCTRCHEAHRDSASARP